MSNGIESRRMGPLTQSLCSVLTELTELLRLGVLRSEAWRIASEAQRVAVVQEP